MCNKRRHTEWGAKRAMAALKERSKRKGANYGVYRCQACRGWHVTSHALKAARVVTVERP